MQVLPRFRQKLLLRGPYLYGLFGVDGAVDWTRFHRDCKMIFFSPAPIQAFGNAVLTKCCEYDPQLKRYCRPSEEIPLKWIPKNVLVTIARHLSLLFRLRKVKIGLGLRFTKWSDAPKWWSQQYDLLLMQTIQDWGFSSSARILEKLRGVDETLAMLHLEILATAKREELFMKRGPVLSEQCKFLSSLNTQEERIRTLINDAFEYAKRQAMSERPKLNASALLPVNGMTFGQSPITLYLAAFRATETQTFFILTWTEHPECQRVEYNLDMVYRILASSVVESGKLAGCSESLIPKLPPCLPVV